jgi:phosphoglycolate phosphatase
MRRPGRCLRARMWCRKMVCHVTNVLRHLRSNQSVAVRYKLAIFDFDGTLADTFPWFLSAVNRMAEIHGFNRVEAADIETLRGYSARQIMGHLGVPAWKLPTIGIDMRRLMAEDIRQIRLFDGVGAMLRGLSDRAVVLAVMTSNAYDNVNHVLGAERAALISYYECGTSLFGKRGKLRRVLKKSGVRPGEAIFIGDEIRDIEAARAEGIPFGAVAWGYTHVEVLEAHAPAEVFAAVGEVVVKVA